MQLQGACPPGQGFDCRTKLGFRGSLQAWGLLMAWSGPVLGAISEKQLQMPSWCRDGLGYLLSCWMGKVMGRETWGLLSFLLPFKKMSCKVQRK